MPTLHPTIRPWLLASLATLLTGCDIPGLGPDPAIAKREAEAKAIGGGCRHALRSIEDCYNLNERASKAAIFDGWKEMDQYMRENKIEGVRPTETKAEPAEEVITESKTKPKAGSPTTDKASPGAKATDKTTDKAADKTGAKTQDKATAR